MKRHLLAHGSTHSSLGFNLEMMLVGGALVALGLKFRASGDAKPIAWALMILAGLGLMVASVISP